MPTGPYLISGRDHTTQLWDVAANKTVLNLSTTSRVYYVAHAAEGAVVVAGIDDRSVRFWDSVKGQLRGVILSEPGYIVYLTTDGYWRADSRKDVDLVYVAQTDQGQVTLSADEFAARFHWKNVPTKVKMVTR
jgi:WD40 repeat protein